MAIKMNDMKNIPEAESTALPGGRAGTTTTAGRRFKYGLSVGVLMLSVTFILVMVNWGASSYGRRFDLTAGRAYSLSPQTLAILESLELKATLTLLFAESDPNMTAAEQARAGAARRQVEDVLREFEQRSEMIDIRRIDPTDHRAQSSIDALYESLRESRKELIAEYEGMIEESRSEITAVNAFLQEELALGGDQLSTLDQSHQQWRQFRQIQEAVAGLPSILNRLLAEADGALQTGIGQPLPDWEQARSILVSTFGEPAGTFTEIARLCRAAAEDVSLSGEFRATLEPMAVRFSEAADRMLTMRDALADLKAINLARLVRRIATQNTVLLSDATDTIAIPFNTLFPMPSLEEMERGAMLDRRFAGERVISTALRRLTIKNPSTVVICHAEAGNPLRSRGQGVASISAVTEQVRDLGFDVQVWDVMEGERPEVRGNEFGHPVWVILPPRPNPGAPESAQAGARLADIAEDLVESGERVMMNFWPSPMVGFGQPDYWNAVTRSLGVRADSGKQVFRRVTSPNGRSSNEAFIELAEYSEETLLGKALNGLDTIITAPVPLLLIGEEGYSERADGVVSATNDADDEEGSAIKRWVVADIQMTKQIWVEENWMQGGAGLTPPSEVASEPVHAVVAIERGMRGKTQRCLVIGSVYWFDDYPVLLSNQAAGGIFFSYPGNAELFTSGVCWLAGIDELIAPSAMTQTVARIRNIGSGAILTYRIFLMAVLPLTSLGLGIGVWFWRRG